MLKKLLVAICIVFSAILVSGCSSDSTRLQNNLETKNKGVDWDNVKNSPQNYFRSLTKEEGACQLNDGECILTKYAGDEEIVKIPQTVNNVKLASIGGYKKVEASPSLAKVGFSHGIEVYEPFKDNKRIKSVYVPDGVTTLSVECFAGCEQLKEIRLPDSITKVYANTFDGCENVEISYKGITYTQNTIDDFFDLFEVVD